LFFTCGVFFKWVVERNAKDHAESDSPTNTYTSRKPRWRLRPLCSPTIFLSSLFVV
jgi:fatty acid desaturase